MMQIPYTLRRKEQINERNSTRIPNNPGVLILCIQAKWSVWHNDEIQNPPQNSKIRRIGCISVLPYASLEHQALDEPKKKALILQWQLWD